MDPVRLTKPGSAFISEMQQVINHYGDMPVVVAANGHGYEPALWTAGNAGEQLTLVVMCGEEATLASVK